MVFATVVVVTQKPVGTVKMEPETRVVMALLHLRGGAGLSTSLAPTWLKIIPLLQLTQFSVR